MARKVAFTNYTERLWIYSMDASNYLTFNGMLGGGIPARDCSVSEQYCQLYQTTTRGNVVCGGVICQSG
jgi:hypothetical protein